MIKTIQIIKEDIPEEDLVNGIKFGAIQEAIKRTLCVTHIHPVYDDCFYAKFPEEYLIHLSKRQVNKLDNDPIEGERFRIRLEQLP